MVSRQGVRVGGHGGETWAPVWLSNRIWGWWAVGSPGEGLSLGLGMGENREAGASEA